MKRGIFVIMTLLSLIPSKLWAVDADVLVRNQRFSADTFFFDIYLQATTSSNLFICNSDFALSFTEANFTNPELFYLSGSNSFVNCYGNSVSTFYDTNIGTRLQYEGLNEYKLMIYVQMPVYNSYNEFLNVMGVVNQDSLTHKLGTFFITGATALNTNPELSWITSGKGLILLVNQRDSVTMEKTSVVADGINPVIETEPDTQASNLSVTAKTSTSISLSWTRGNGDGTVLFVKEGSPINELPVDGIQYLPDTVFGNGDQIGTSGIYSVYKGSDSTTTITGLDNSTTYYFALMEYRGNNGWSENYITANADTVSEETNGPFITANIKVFLQGPYNTATGSMNTHLRMGNSFGTINLLPAAQPYNAAPWNYTGTENVDTARHPVNAVDWVLVELRSTFNGAPVSGGRAAGFLLSDGSIVDTNGVDAIRFWAVNPGYYYVVIKHRNHLPVMSRDSILLDVNSIVYDFTNGGQGRAYGTDTTTFRLKPMSDLATGIYGMRGGDGGGSVAYQVRYNGGGLNDRLAMRNFVGASTASIPQNNLYNRFDINLDRQIRYNGGGLNDRVRTLNWIGGASNSALPLITPIPNP